jgi:hypothetical protein
VLDFELVGVLAFPHHDSFIYDASIIKYLSSRSQNPLFGVPKSNKYFNFELTIVLILYLYPTKTLSPISTTNQNPIQSCRAETNPPPKLRTKLSLHPQTTQPSLRHPPLRYPTDRSARSTTMKQSPSTRPTRPPLQSPPSRSRSSRRRRTLRWGG